VRQDLRRKLKRTRSEAQAERRLIDSLKQRIAEIEQQLA